MAEEQKPADPAQPPAQPAPAAPPPEADSLDSPQTSDQAMPADAPTGVGEPQQAPHGSGLKSTFNIYFIIFIVVVALAGGGIFYVVSSANKSGGNVKKTQSLTSDQLSTLKGNTTLVGSGQTTLDVQSNAVFEGEVLTRSDLSVAGNLKVGGALSLNNINVGGIGSFGGLSVSGTSTFSNNVAVQGALSVQKGLTVNGSASFGSLNVGQLGVTTLQLTGDLSVNRHIVTSGGVPSRVSGTALGGGGTTSISGSDTAGTLSVNTGNNPAAGVFATITFTQHFPSTPRVMITPIGSAAGGIDYYVTRDSSGFSIGTSSPPPAGASFAFDYFVID